MRIEFKVLLTICVLGCTLVVGQTKPPISDSDSPDKDYSAELPRIPPKSPQESLKSIRLRAGFQAELVAHEPLIRSPMAMDFDEFGRAFVVELPEYNQYASPKPHGKGAIKMLEDTDGDGRFDKASIYVDELSYPTAVACWDGGVLVGAAPDLLYCKDTDNDGRADVRQKLLTGFVMDKAGEGMLNSIRWRIDNRFQISTGLNGGEIVSVSAPSGPGSNSAVQPPDKPINARGQHLIVDPRTMHATPTSGGGQHGMSLDDWSLRCFVCGNSEPVHFVMYDGRYLARNPYLEAPAAALNIAPDGKFTKLMRISGVEPWRVLRTRLRSKGVIPGSDEGGTPSGFFTGATGITVYRGDAWPAEFRGQLFVGEVANNLVYRASLEPNGVGYTAHRADLDAEFLASSDNWFRPVQFANAPDGTLYVLDMYRELIEGAAFLAPIILKHMDTSAGADKGRIYRIAPSGFTSKATPRVGDLPTVELVKLLEHSNAWHRDTASRLIYQRQDPAAVDPLRKLAISSPVLLARMMALYSLRGLSALDSHLVREVLRGTFDLNPSGRGRASDETSFREHALRLAEDFPADREIGTAVVKAAESSDLRVRFQAAFSLGAFDSPEATQQLVQLLIRDGNDSWMRLAILSSIALRRVEFLGELLAKPEVRALAHVKPVLGTLAVQIGSSNDARELGRFAQQLEAHATSSDGAGLVRELARSLLTKYPAAKSTLVKSGGERISNIIRAMEEDAIKTAADLSKSNEDRVAAIRSLVSMSFPEIESLFRELLSSQQPQPVQVSALQTLARFSDSRISNLVLSAWPRQTPQLRATSIETLFTRGVWISEFLDAVEQQRVGRADLDPARIAILQKHADPAIRSRSSSLFSSTALARRQDVVDAYQSALELQGDIERGRTHFRKTCAACHKIEGFGESIGADLNAIRDRGTAAVLLNILDPNREVKPQFLNYVLTLTNGRTITGMIATETANSLTIRKADNTNETVLRVDIDELRSTGLSYMPEGLEKQLDPAAMADVLAYLNSIK